MAIEPLGVPLWTWAGLFALGGLGGLVLSVTAKPQGSALPRFAPRGRWLGEDGAHFLYGGLAALLGALVVSLLSGLAHPLALGVAWIALLLAGAWFGSSARARRVSLEAHAKVLGAIVALVSLGYLVTELLIFR